MEVKTGTKVDHERYGEGVITEATLSGFTVVFNRGWCYELLKAN